MELDADDQCNDNCSTEEAGDCYARLIVRREEIKQSIKIIKQILDEMPEGPYFADKYMKLVNPKMRELVEQSGILRFPALFLALKPDAGEAISRVEASRGEVLYHIVSDGTTQPYRMRMVTPSFKNIIGFKWALLGERLADVPAVYGSLDYFPPEADR